MHKKSVGILFSIILIFTSCNEKNESSAIKETKIIESNNLDGEKEKIVITYAAGMEETPTIMEVIKNYNKNNDEIYVKYQELPQNEETRDNMIIESFEEQRKEYDIVDINYTFLTDFAEKNYIVDITKYIEKDKIDLSKYLKSTILSVTNDNRIFALPRSIYTSLLYYRKDIVEKPPKTWDDLIYMSKILKTNYNFLYGYICAGYKSRTLTLEIIEFINYYGGQILDVDGKYDLNKDSVIKGLDKFKEIYFSDFVPEDLKNITENEASARFLNGESVFLRSTPKIWSLVNNESSKVFNKIAVTSIPTNINGLTPSINGFCSVINNNSNNKEAAWDFIKYMASEEAQKIMAIDEGRMPVIKSLYNDKDVIDKNPHFATENLEKYLENAFIRPKTTNYIQVANIVRDEFEKFILYGESSEQTANSLELRIMEVIPETIALEN